MVVTYSVSKQRALARYQKTGRYVPMEVIDDFFTMLPGEHKTKGQYALDQLKSVVDGYAVVDGVNGNVIKQRGEDLPKKRYYTSQHVQLVAKSEEKLERAKKSSSKPSQKSSRKASTKKPVAPTRQPGQKELIEKQITALKTASMFAPDKSLIEKQIKVLTTALQFAA